MMSTIADGALSFQRICNVFVWFAQVDDVAENEWINWFFEIFLLLSICQINRDRETWNVQLWMFFDSFITEIQCFVSINNLLIIYLSFDT